MKELKKEDIFGMREILQDFGNAVFYIESDAAEDSAYTRSPIRGAGRKMYCLCQKPGQSSGKLPGNRGICGYIRNLAGELGVSCRILDHMELKEQGFGGILAVNQAVPWSKTGASHQGMRSGTGIYSFGGQGYSL